MSDSPQEISQLLVAWSNGDKDALDRLMPLVYGELHRMAQGYMARQPAGHILQPTALINELCLKLMGQEGKRWQNRAHFLRVAARAMRNILVDYARNIKAVKRGGEAVLIQLDPDETAFVTNDQAGDILALHDALNSLDEISPRQCSVVELRYFGGLTVQETAEVLKVSPETVTRDW